MEVWAMGRAWALRARSSLVRYGTGGASGNKCSRWKQEENLLLGSAKECKPHSWPHSCPSVLSLH